MSHISKIELEVKDIQILDKACARMGLMFQRGKQTFKWYSKESRCDHAIGVPGTSYEIGITKIGGKYELECDFYDPNIEAAIGKDGGLLKQAYAVEKTRTEARRKGYSVVERQLETGIRLQIQLV